MKRESIMTNDLEHCIVCDSPRVEIHHIFGGANRNNSDRFGLFVPLCHRHHNEPPEGVHFDKGFRLSLQAKAQARFETVNSHEDFMRIFGADYIEKYKAYIREAVNQGQED